MCKAPYFTEQHRHPFLNSSHSSYSSPDCPTARLFSTALPEAVLTVFVSFHFSYTHMYQIQCSCTFSKLIENNGNFFLMLLSEDVVEECGFTCTCEKCCPAAPAHACQTFSRVKGTQKSSDDCDGYLGGGDWDQIRSFFVRIHRITSRSLSVSSRAL